MASRRHVRYHPLAADERDGDSSGEEKDADLRYVYMPKSLKKIPWKSTALALFLLALGSVLLFLSFFVFIGHMAGDQSQAYAFLLLGILVVGTSVPVFGSSVSLVDLIESCIYFFMMCLLSPVVVQLWDHLV